MNAPTTKAPDLADRVQAQLLELVIQSMDLHVHLSNLLRMSEPKAQDELFTLISAAIRYADEAFQVVQKMDELANAEPETIGEVKHG